MSEPLVQEVVRLKMLMMSNTAIAKSIGVGVRRISKIVESDDFEHMMNYMQAARNMQAIDIDLEIERGAEMGIRELRRMQMDESVPVKERIAIHKDLLDRHGKSRIIRKEVKDVSKEDSMHGIVDRVNKRFEDFTEVKDAEIVTVEEEDDD